MNCLLIAATAKEIEPFIRQYRDGQNRFSENIGIDILIPGIGLTATAYHLTRQLHLRRPDLVVQVGIAGCFDKRLKLGTVVNVQADTIADEGVVESKKLKTLFDLGFLEPGQFPFRKGVLANTNTALLKKNKLKRVKGISVNQVTSSAQMIRLYRNKFSPITESMEGAALHYICLQEKIPFLQLRAVSNYIGERNKKNWNIKDAIVNLNQELTRFFETL